MARPTLKTIAEATGFAVPTVSRALSDAPDLATETKARVREAATRLGYVPNRAGLRLRTGRTQVISLVMSTEHDMMNHTARLISSVAGALRGTPYHLNITPTFPDEDPLRAIRAIVENGLADAVIFNQTAPRDARVAWLMERRFPFATHGRTDWADRHPWADFDNRAFAALAGRALADRGRRRVVAVAPPLAQAYAHHFLAGLGAGATPLSGVTSDDPAPAVQAAVARALRDGADGVICASTSAAMAAVAALEETGRVLGADGDVVGKEAIPFLRLFRRGIIVVAEDVARVGEVLARAAIRAIKEPDAPPLQDLEVPVAIGGTA